jgi:hypothetical protein
MYEVSQEESKTLQEREFEQLKIFRTSKNHPMGQRSGMLEEVQIRNFLLTQSSGSKGIEASCEPSLLN